MNKKIVEVSLSDGIPIVFRSLSNNNNNNVVIKICKKQKKTKVACRRDSVLEDIIKRDVIKIKSRSQC